MTGAKVFILILALIVASIGLFFVIKDRAPSEAIPEISDEGMQETDEAEETMPPTTQTAPASSDDSDSYATPYGTPYGTPYFTPYGTPYSTPYSTPSGY